MKFRSPKEKPTSKPAPTPVDDEGNVQGGCAQSIIRDLVLFLILGVARLAREQAPQYRNNLNRHHPDNLPAES